MRAEIKEHGNIYMQHLKWVVISMREDASPVGFYLPPEAAKDLARRINAHDGLVAALKRFTYHATCDCAGGCDGGCDLCHGRKALAEARGK